MSRLWTESHADIDIEDDIKTATAVNRIIERAAGQDEGTIELVDRRRIRRIKQRSVAALGSVLAICLAAWFWMNTSRENAPVSEKQQEPIVVNNGSRSRSLLPDGTTVWLNAGSRLHYENDFNGATREVRLEGEAFFDVVKKPGRPFIVHTANINIKVLGTAFNVKSYPEDKNVETTLYRGLVEVSRQEDVSQKVIELHPNEKLILAKQAANKDPELSNVNKTPANRPFPDYIKTHIDSTKRESERFETAWLYSRLEFRGSNFEDLAFKLERWYNVTIEFADEKVKYLNFYGSFEKENVEQAFAALKIAVPDFDYKIENQKVTISATRHMLTSPIK